MNKLGTKWSLVLGAMSFPIQGASYYCNSKFGTQWVSVFRFLSRTITHDHDSFSSSVLSSAVSEQVAGM